MKIYNIEKDIKTNKQQKFKKMKQIVFFLKKKNDVIPKHFQLFFSQLILSGWGRVPIKIHNVAFIYIVTLLMC